MRERKLRSYRKPRHGSSRGGVDCLRACISVTNSYLPHKSVPWQVSTDVPGAARSVQFLGTTAPRPESFGNSEWTADLEYVWRTRTAGVRERLDARARAMRRAVADARRMEAEFKRQDALIPAMRVQAERSAEWAEHRARAVAMARVDVVTACDQRWRSVACGCSRFEMRVGCDQPQLCLKCRKRHSALWRKRIVAGMDHALRSERAAWYRTPAYRRRGMKPGIYLITLTAPHSGDMQTDRAAMGDAVRKLLKHGTKTTEHRAAWFQTYALTWEATSGDDGKGHVHCHLAVIASWVPYTTEQVLADAPRAKGERRKRTRGLREVWADAMPGAVVVDIKAPRNGADDAMSAGQYLAKYVTKGVDAAEFTGAKAGELLCAFRSRRKVSTSAHFWRRDEKRCDCCGELFALVESPCSLQELAPGAVLRSKAERARYWIPRGEPQAAIRWGANSLSEPRARVRTTRRGSRSVFGVRALVT